MVNYWNDLEKAIGIFKKYADLNSPPFHCEHDTLMICGVDPEKVSDEDKAILLDLGFFVSKNFDLFISYRFGSA